jgi:iron complex transport system ATP-binding protein
VSIITLESLTTGYRQGGAARRVSTGLTGTLRAGEFTVLLGPNGAGKSTLLRTLAGLQPPLAGIVRIDGDDVMALTPRERAKRLGVVLTEQVKVWGLSVLQLVSMGRQPHTGWSGTLAAADRLAVQQALAAAGALDLARRQVAELSDGERQRVMVARALAQEPRALILDEVTAFLDLPRRVDIMRMLRRLAHDRGHALLLSTHDLDLALRTADRIWLMSSDGGFHAGSPEDLVLSGALHAVFRHEGLHFDAADGAFRLHADVWGRVGLHGHGLAGQWTRRALERMGFEVTAVDVSAVRVEVEVPSQGSPRWRLVGVGATTEHASIDELASAMRSTGAARGAGHRS